MTPAGPVGTVVALTIGFISTAHAGEREFPACTNFQDAVQINEIWQDGAGRDAAKVFAKSHECDLFDHGAIVETKTDSTGKIIAACVVAGLHTRGPLTCDRSGWWTIVK
jgi:hypothetical protein